LYLDGRLLIGETYESRWATLASVAPPDLLVERLISERTEEIEAFLRRALEEGHEGLMAKRLDGRYTPGKRGKLWLKIKPAETIDVVIVAAEWGYGRRRGWLSNYHLAVRDGEGFAMIGKTFKGLTDQEFEWMTKKLQGITTSDERWGVRVRPELVVEVDYNEIQKSPRYESGFALRFARVKRIREDKGPGEADTLDRLKQMYEKQFERKGRVAEP
jgi:DNA ligase-1